MVTGMEFPRAKDPLVSRNKVANKHQASNPHWHDTYELYYMVNGRTTYFIEDEIYSVEKGNFVFIPKGLIHKTDNENCKSNERLLISFEEALFSEKGSELKEKLMQQRIITIPENHQPELEELLLKIEAEFYKNESGKEFLLELYIQTLLILICRYQCESKMKISESDKLIYTVSEYIKQNFDQELTLGELSRIFSISEGYLSRKFRQVTGIGVNQYITFVRISNGERLLKEGKLSVTEVASCCGYNDSNYFAAVFKKVKGVTPLHYRKQKKRIQ